MQELSWGMFCRAGLPSSLPSQRFASQPCDIAIAWERKPDLRLDTGGDSSPREKRQRRIDEGEVAGGRGREGEWRGRRYGGGLICKTEWYDGEEYLGLRASGVGGQRLVGTVVEIIEAGVEMGAWNAAPGPGPCRLLQHSSCLASHFFIYCSGLALSEPGCLRIKGGEELHDNSPLFRTIPAASTGFSPAVTR